MNFRADRWLGNQWASIEIDPVDEHYFLPLLIWLVDTYNFAMPSIVDSIDGYFANFELSGCEGTIGVDAWTFSIAFAEDSIRDQVLEALLELPSDYFT